MKHKKEVFALAAVGLFILAVILVPSPFQPASKLQRGDKVHITGLDEEGAAAVEGCDITFIASTPTSNDNIALITFQNCNVQKENPAIPAIAADLASLDRLEKVK